MKTLIFKYEFRKFLGVNAIWILIIISIVINYFYAALLEYDTAGLAKSASENSYTNAYDVFDNFNCMDILDSIYESENSSCVSNLMKEKYKKLQLAVDEKGVNNDSLCGYFNKNSSEVHASIFGGYGKLVIVESLIISILTTLYITGYENINSTSNLIFTTKTGRKLMTIKCITSFIICSILTLILYVVSWFTMFSINSFSEVWKQNISSFYNTANGFPFITWQSMNVWQYFMCSTLISFIINMIFIAVSVPFCILIKNSFAAFGTYTSTIFLNIILIMSIPKTSLFYYILMMTPIGLLSLNQLWFTDGYSYFFIPHFEILITILYVIIGFVLMLSGIKIFHRKDLN